jgi:hypothetical protein
MICRVGEGLLASLPILSKLEILRLATLTDSAKALSFGASIFAVAEEVWQRPDASFSEFLFVSDGFTFSFLFLKGRLIPLWLAWVGVITIGAQAVCVPLHVAGYLTGSVVEALWMAIMFYEVPLGVYLIWKGVSE